MIALGYRNLPDSMNYRKIQRMERTDSEKDLTFLGLIVMENRLENFITDLELHPLSPGLVVMGRDSRSEGCGFESRHYVYTGCTFFHMYLL